MESDPKEKKCVYRRRGQGGHMLPVTKAMYEKMWVMFKAATPLRDIAKAVGVHEKTVAKYAEVGDPSRGLEPMMKRLEAINDRLRRRIGEVHSRERAKQYTKAKEAFAQSLGIATQSMTRMKQLQDRAKDKELEDFDDGLFGRMLKNATMAADLVIKWNEITTALYVGEHSQQMLEDIKSFEETGDLSPELEKTLQEIMNRRRQQREQ